MNTSNKRKRATKIVILHRMKRLRRTSVANEEGKKHLYHYYIVITLFERKPLFYTLIKTSIVKCGEG